MLHWLQQMQQRLGARPPMWPPHVQHLRCRLVCRMVQLQVAAALMMAAAACAMTPGRMALLPHVATHSAAHVWLSMWRVLTRYTWCFSLSISEHMPPSLHTFVIASAQLWSMVHFIHAAVQCNAHHARFLSCIVCVWMCVCVCLCESTPQNHVPPLDASLFLLVWLPCHRPPAQCADAR
jgi:hypothetical protein